MHNLPRSINTNTLSPENEVVPKYRVIHDCTFSGPSNKSINNRIDKNLLEPSKIGFCFQRILHSIHEKRFRHPSHPIFITKHDQDAAFRRLQASIPSTVTCITVIDDIAHLLLRLPFDNRKSMEAYENVGETVADISNDLYQDES